MIERTGEAYELDEQLTVLGAQLKFGDRPPDFALEHQDPETYALSQVALSDSAGAVRVLSIVPSLDTPVCKIQASKWDKLRENLPDNVVLYTISMDLPYAQSRWQSTEHAGHKALSAHKNEAFAVDYGLLIKEWRLLQRAVLVLDGSGVVRYAQYVPDQAAEPEYDPAIATINALIQKE